MNTHLRISLRDYAIKRIPHASPALDAMHRAINSEEPFIEEDAILCAVQAPWHWAEYHRRNWGPIGDDGVLGPAWAQIADGTLQMLNSVTGRVDPGTIDSFIREMAEANNVKLE